ncbi:MAG: LysR family transcriptional regulator [Pseudomonadota bacterium]
MAPQKGQRNAGKVIKKACGFQDLCIAKIPNPKYVIVAEIGLLSLKDLEFLTALARRKHFARAAEDCGVSQPAFSMRIRKIEENLGTAVVKRSNRFQGFTTEGESLLRHAYEILNGLKIMEQDIKAARGVVSGNVSIGVIPTAVIYAARAIKRLRHLHPSVTVSLKTVPSLAIHHGVDNGQFDVGITYGEDLASDLLQIEPLYQERYLLLAPEHLINGKQTSISWREAAELPLCLLEPEMQNRRIIDKVFGDLGLAPEIVTESSGFLASISLASEGMAATIIPEQLASIFGEISSAVALKLIDPELAKPVCLISRSRHLNLPIVNALQAVCSDHNF